MTSINSEKGATSLPSLTQLLTHYRSLHGKCAGPHHAATDAKISKCAECSFVSYCSQKCQKEDWFQHQHSCKILRARLEPVTSEFPARLKSIPPSPIKNKMFNEGQVFVTTNELDHDEVMKTIVKMEPVGNLLIGTSGLCNLNLASVRPSVDHLLILDASFKVKEFWDCVSMIIRASTSREECLSMLTKHVKAYFIPHYTEGYFIQTGQAIRGLELYIKLLDSQESFLSDNAKYNHIKTMFQSGNVVCLTVDIIDTQFCFDIKSHIEAMALKVDTIYVSNILDVVRENSLLDYGRSLDLLMNPDTIVVDVKEKPFKLTKEVSSFYNNEMMEWVVMGESLVFKGLYGPRVSRCFQKIKKREGQTIGELFPLIQLKLEEGVSERFYYEYGLRQKFYSESEADNVSLYVKKKLESNAEHFKSLSEIEKKQYTQRAMYEGFHVVRKTGP